MLARLRRWWNMPLNAWQKLLLSASAVLFWQLVKLAFPVQTRWVVDTFGPSILLVFVLLVPLLVYRAWKVYWAQPPTRG